MAKNLRTLSCGLAIASALLTWTREAGAQHHQGQGGGSGFGQFLNQAVHQFTQPQAPQLPPPNANTTNFGGYGNGSLFPTQNTTPGYNYNPYQPPSPPTYGPPVNATTNNVGGFGNASLFPTQNSAPGYNPYQPQYQQTYQPQYQQAPQPPTVYETQYQQQVPAYQAPQPTYTLGVDGQPVDDGGTGAFQISQVWPGTAAERAGLKAGDVIRASNGYSVQNLSNLRWIINRSSGVMQMKVRDANSGEILPVEVRL
jgi:hypothetical protein